MSTMLYQRIPAWGHFSLDDGTVLNEDAISVKIEQLGSGATQIYYPAEQALTFLPIQVHGGQAVSFTGRAEDGLPLRTSDLRSYLGKNGDRHCFSLSHVTVGDNSAVYSSIELALTNLILDGDGVSAETLAVSIDNTPLAIELTPSKDYAELVFHLRLTDIPNVTANLRMTLDHCHKDTHESLINDLCAALSIVQGRKVQWIRRTAYSPKNALVWSEFGQTKTKDHTHGSFCFNPDKRRGIDLSLADVASALPRLREFQQAYDPNYRIVNSWLDARVQSDYLEARTLKYAIVLEALCELVGSKHDDISSTYVPRSAWRSTGKEFLPRIKSHLDAAFQIDPRIIANACSTSAWGNLNRVGFRTILAESLQKLGISMHGEPNRIRRVTDVRNKIVHSLKYLTDDDFTELTWPAVNATQQHFLVACFVDEVLLRLFGLEERVPSAWIAGFQAHAQPAGVVGSALL
jgi:hypothetical protein